MANGRADEQTIPRGARASRCRIPVWELFGETHLGQRSCSRVKGRTHDRTRSVSQIKQTPLRSRGRPHMHHGSSRGHRLKPYCKGVKPVDGSAERGMSIARLEPEMVKLLPDPAPAAPPRTPVPVRVSTALKITLGLPTLAKGPGEVAPPLLTPNTYSRPAVGEVSMGPAIVAPMWNTAPSKVAETDTHVEIRPLVGGHRPPPYA